MSTYPLLPRSIGGWSFLLSILIGATEARGQCNNPPTLGNDTTLCAGETLLITPGPGFMSYLWDNGSPFNLRAVSETGTYTCTVQTDVLLENAVVNGDFSEGAAGFTSDYVPGTGGTWGLLSAEGTYAVTTNAQNVHNNFSPCNDHSGSGNMLVVNGAATAGATIWCQTVPVTPNTDYAFSTWLSSVTPSNPAVLQFTIDGVLLGTPFTASGTTCDWQEFHVTWNSGASTSVQLCITNQNTAEDGNDFALDEITLSPFCTYTVSIDVDVQPFPVVELGPDTTTCPGTPIVLDATTANATAYRWQDGSTEALFTAQDSGLYRVEVSNGRCSTTDSLRVRYSDCGVHIALPNVFTPNGDGPNAVFTPIAMRGVQRIALSVFNRWGQEVFSSASFDFGWSGRSFGGSLVPEGVYYWTLAYTSREGEEGEQHGTVTVLR
ncbi:MAG: gliding motility-associated C-terminal domain-containing protein [Bacteroidetes bacterium]|nr:gliding motility-associated C-terminal domain-containing protein [Bacteroidota bacterium]